ncbi:hypothetical protein AAVH_04101 [Aphelenchoides avenae]|nr:hypothetical protein AAVH_04101 [Aphelenchus avenae]
MGGALSSVGFNQPFFYTLIGIILILTLTVAVVSDPTEDDHEPELPRVRLPPQYRISIGKPLDRSSKCQDRLV